MNNSKILKEMKEIYKPKSVDWMGFIKTAENYYTLHHITKKQDGGKTEIENSAILTLLGHHVLHNVIELYNPELYFKWTLFFREINSRMAPLDEELIERREELKNETISLIEEYNENRKQNNKSRILYKRF